MGDRGLFIARRVIYMPHLKAKMHQIRFLASVRLFVS